jgi:hypothetical protein
LWVADAATGKTKAIANLRINDLLSAPFEWMANSTHLKVVQVPPNRGRMPETPRVPFGPNVEETQGKISKMPTFQDLLRTPYDEALFEHFAASQIAVVNAVTGEVRPIGAQAILARADFSPDEKSSWSPNSGAFPSRYSYFTRSIMWDTVETRRDSNRPPISTSPGARCAKGPAQCAVEGAEPSCYGWRAGRRRSDEKCRTATN